MFQMLRQTAAISALTLSTIALAPAAIAASEGTAEVRIGDLDLTSAAGKAELASRVDAVAQRLCRTDPATGSLIRDRAASRACVANVQRQIETRLALRTGTENRSR
ncbi:MAG: UrcA family protein [Novosphingobium sp.]